MSKGPSDRASARPWSRFGALTRESSASRLVNLAVVVGVLVLNLCQQPGRLTFDTKLDLQVDPFDFLVRSLSLWNGDSAVGGLQNQASGYLFPMGPAFLLGDFLGVPMWVWERLWSAVVMLVAYEGARRLALAWPGIGRSGAVVAGLAYMLAPRVLTTVGGLSGETLPGSVLPWTVLPLVLYLTGRMSARLAFVLSAATIPWMGGQNATLVLACLILPGLLLLLAAGRSRRRVAADVAGWSVLALAGCLWWLVPLFLLGGYGPPFLDFIESSRHTAGSIGWASALRGTDHWVAFFSSGGAGWVGGFRIATSSVLMVTTVLAAGAGLAGLLDRRLWCRRVLVASLLVGLAVLTAGSGGWAGSPFSVAWLDALDGPLAPLRNVHKFDPLVRLPLSLGLGVFAVATVPRLAAIAGRWRVGVPVVRQAVLGSCVVVLLATAFPAVTGDLRNADGVEEFSPSWTQAVAYLDAQPGPVSALVLPGAGSAVQTWGRTVDEPIQVLDGPAWVARSQATVAPAATLRLLDSIETHLVSGRPYDGLTETMNRLGATHLVVRNDLDLDQSDAPPPETVYAAVGAAPGVRSVARFGGTGLEHPDIEVFTVGAREPRVTLSDGAARPVVQGAPEVVDDLVRAGLVGSGQATLIGEDSQRADIVTDSNRRVERRFGRLHESRSAVMTEAEGFRVTRPAHDYTGEGVPEGQTTAEYDGVTRLEASSSTAYADAVGAIHPEEHPYAAFDGSLFTSWASSPDTSPRGQWLEVEFDAVRELGPVDLLFDVTTGVRVSAVELRTDHGTRTVPVGPTGAVTGVHPPPGLTGALRISVVGAGTSGQVRLANVRIGGAGLTRSLRVPGSVTSGASVHLQAETPRRACLPVASGASCRGERLRLSVEAPGLERTLTVAEDGTWQLGGRVVGVDGPATENLLAPIFDARVRVQASSVFAGDPLVAGAHAFDARTDTSWYASPVDASPTLVLSWDEARRIRSVEAVLDSRHPGRLPTEILVEADGAGGAPQVVPITGPEAGRMRPIRTNRLRITVPKGPDLGDKDAVGITELAIGGLDDLRHTPAPSSATGAACGFGPRITVGDRTIDTEVRGRLADVLDGSALQFVPCTNDGTVRLEPGEHRVRVDNPAGFALTELWLEPVVVATPSTRAADPSPDGPFDADVDSWSSTSRTVRFSAPGPAVLALGESYNVGWEARLAGKLLEPTPVDGWRQGWLVPAGSGLIELRFAPQRAFTVSTIIGLLLAAALNVAAAVLLARRRSKVRPGVTDAGSDPDRTRDTRLPRPIVVLLALALAVVSVPLAIGAVVGAATRRVPTAVAAAAGMAALLFAAGIAVVGAGSQIRVPEVTDVIVALVVGALAGRMVTEAGQPTPDPVVGPPVGRSAIR